MDKDLLVSSGHSLLDAMDEEDMGVRFAMWVHSTDTDTWKLWLTPKATLVDKREFYRKVSEITSRDRAKLGGLDASDTEFVLDKHPAVKGIGMMFRVDGRSSVHFSGNNFNGYYMPDGIILRSLT